MPNLLLLLLLLTPLPPVPAWTCRIIPGVIVLLGVAVNHLGTVNLSSLLAPAHPESSELPVLAQFLPPVCLEFEFDRWPVLTLCTFKKSQHRKLSTFNVRFFILYNIRSLLLLFCHLRTLLLYYHCSICDRSNPSDRYVWKYVSGNIEQSGMKSGENRRNRAVDVLTQLDS